MRGLSSVGRASALHAEGQEFESPSLHKKPNDICYSVFYFMRVNIYENSQCAKVHFKSLNGL